MLKSSRCARMMDRRGGSADGIKAPLTGAADQTGIVLANLPAGPRESRAAFAVAIALLGMAVIVAPFASVQLPRSDAWIPITNTYIFLADLVTWVLLISQFDIVRWHALLVVASGYLFTAMMAVPLLLTFRAHSRKPASLVPVCRPMAGFPYSGFPGTLSQPAAMRC